VVRGSTATQPIGSSSSKYATSPLVLGASGWSQWVWARSMAVRCSSVESRHIQPRTLSRWQWHLPQ
jgi:hypothetical protein